MTGTNECNRKTLSEIARAACDYSDRMIEEWETEDDLKDVPEKHRLMTRQLRGKTT